MAVFNYRAKDQEGITKEGIVEAGTLVAASDLLHKNGLTVLSIEPSDQINFRFEKYIPFLGRVSRKELVMFSRQLSTLMNAKIPIVQAMEILQSQVSSQSLKNIVLEIIESVEGGKSLSEAIENYPEIFSDLYISMVRSGEMSGTLDLALNYLADQQEKDYDLISKVRGAMTYPIFIVSAIFIVGGLMFVFVLPQMISVLLEAGAELPITTRILIFATETLQKFWAFLLILFVAMVIGARLYVRSSGGRYIWDALKLKIPIMGKLLKNIYMDRFSRNLSTLVGGGIPIVQALKTVAGIVGNTVYRRIIMEAAADVETGKSLGAVLEERDEMPRIVTQMIRVGEQTGSLSDIMGKLAKFYDKEVENALNTLTTLLEPVIMILLGAAVAVMVAGILLPIYNLASVQ